LIIDLVNNSVLGFSLLREARQLLSPGHEVPTPVRSFWHNANPYLCKSLLISTLILETVRIDKWLWAVRIFKTRNQATEACRAGKVKLNGQTIKPSHEAKTGEEFSVQIGPLIKTIRVINLLHNRVSAKLAVDFVEDLTPKEEYERLKMQHETNYEYRDKGIGRPTKKQRRLIDKLKKFKHF
jgi:ribosome-associated heat shock protein Hsp15